MSAVPRSASMPSLTTRVRTAKLPRNSLPRPTVSPISTLSLSTPTTRTPFLSIRLRSLPALSRRIGLFFPLRPFLTPPLSSLRTGTSALKSPTRPMSSLRDGTTFPPPSLTLPPSSQRTGMRRRMVLGRPLPSTTLNTRVPGSKRPFPTRLSRAFGLLLSLRILNISRILPSTISRTLDSSDLSSGKSRLVPFWITSSLPTLLRTRRPSPLRSSLPSRPLSRPPCPNLWKPRLLRPRLMPLPPLP
mmetsp:Transcript_25783/g.47065  ORF Transcript_25783/g.47065 Transcript_25783/m.47065 type:complete len:245 (+) Transcript_25783:448-1182(+)